MDRAHIINELASRFGISFAEAADAFEEAGGDEFAAAELIGRYHARYGAGTGYSTDRRFYMTEQDRSNDGDSFRDFARSLFDQIGNFMRSLFTVSVVVADKSGRKVTDFPLILAVIGCIFAAPVFIIIAIILLSSGKEILTEGIE